VVGKSFWIIWNLFLRDWIDHYLDKVSTKHFYFSLSVDYCTSLSNTWFDQIKWWKLFFQYNLSKSEENDNKSATTTFSFFFIHLMDLSILKYSLILAMEMKCNLTYRGVYQYWWKNKGFSRTPTPKKVIGNVSRTQYTCIIIYIYIYIEV